MFWRRQEALKSKEYIELKELCSVLQLSLTSLEASFTNLTNQVLKKIRKSRPKIEEDIEAEDSEKDKLYKGVMLPEK